MEIWFTLYVAKCSKKNIDDEVENVQNVDEESQSYNNNAHSAMQCKTCTFSAFWKQNCNPKFKTVKLYFNTQLGFYVGTVSVLN